MDEKNNSPWMPQVSGAGKDVLEQLVRNNVMVINSPLIRRSLITEIGPFDPRLPPAEDWDYWLRCAAAGKRFQFLDMQDTLALVRIHPASSSKNRLMMYKAILLIRKRLAALLHDKNLLSLNRELRARDESEVALMEATQSPTRAMCHLFNSAVLERRWKWKMKLFACALISPFVSESGLRSMMTTPLQRQLRTFGEKA
jgi:GT2 family glycosyltransferase